MSDKKFVTVISCMDGRVQEPLIKWMKDQYGVEYVDDITEPGPDCIVCSKDNSKITDIKGKVLISVEKHGSRVVAIAGHFDCAGNPGTEEEHKAEIQKSVDVIKSWGLGVEVVGLWVGSNWSVTKVC